MSNPNAYQFKHVIKELGYEINELGYVGLKLTSSFEVPSEIEEDLYFHEDLHGGGGLGLKDLHTTLKYGLLPQVTRQQTIEVLYGWERPKTVDIHYFELFQGDGYVVLVGRVQAGESLKEAHTRLSFLPHIDTYSEYKPHVTIGYLTNSRIGSYWVNELNNRLKYVPLKVKDMSYGRLH